MWCVAAVVSFKCQRDEAAIANGTLNLTFSASHLQRTLRIVKNNG